MREFLNNTLSRKINFFIAILMILFSLVVISAVYIDTKNYDIQKKRYGIAIAENIFESNMNFEKTSLLQTLVAVKNNTEYLKAFKNGDRQKLLGVTEKFFKELKTKHNITHFYFITPDKKCFLRVHKPQEYGDTIERVTLAKAVETKAEFVSLEMGRNFFSLRAVTPIFYDGKLLGYMELGREIDHFFGLFKKQTGFDISLLLDNKYVEKYRLMTDTHLVPDGKSIGDFLILNSSNPQLAATLLQNIKIKDITKDSLDDFWVGGTAYSCYSKNIYDANGELAGRLLFSSDNTKMHSTVAMQYIVILVLTLVFAFLLAYGMKAWIQKEILKPIEKIRSGVVNFFDFIKGDTKTVKYIEPMKNNEIGFIGNVLNENMTETIRILKQNKTNEAYLLQRSRVVALGEMISNIAYHWRQPLNVISVVAQDMRYAKAEGELSDEYFNNSIEKIVDTSKNLSITLNKFSNFYKQPKNKEIFCVEDEIGRSIDFFKDINADLHAKIEYVFESKHMIKNYKGELSQAALNILKNANEAILRRNVQDGRIAISVTKKENSIKISISDNGGGIGAQEMEKIFDPYFTTKYKTNDVGLGLYLTKMMIEKNMGGILTAQNDEDGLKIEIELPLTKES